MARRKFDDDFWEAPAPWKGMLAGLAGGLVASWVMNLVPKPEPPEQQRGDDATVKAASAVSEAVAEHQLSEDEKEVAGPLVHYIFGSAMGALYGGISELWPATHAAWGLPFGMALWLAADEAAVPALGLSDPPTETPAAVHAWAVGVHLVYGLTTDTVRRAVRAAL